MSISNGRAAAAGGSAGLALGAAAGTALGDSEEVAFQFAVLAAPFGALISVAIVRGWLNTWSLPFMLLVLSPVVTVPWQVERIGAMAHTDCVLVAPAPEGIATFNAWRCSAADMARTLAPGCQICCRSPG